MKWLGLGEKGTQCLRRKGSTLKGHGRLLTLETDHDARLAVAKSQREARLFHLTSAQG